MGYIRKPKPVIKIYRDERNPLWRWLGVSLGLVVVVSLIGSFYFFSNEHAGRGSEVESLRALAERLETENRALQAQLAQAERSSAIDRSAVKDLMTTLASREKELAKLREDLTFYKRMVTAGGKSGESSIGIRSFQLKAGAKSGQYRYELVVARVNGKGKAVKGRVELRLQGEQGDESKTLSWDEISLSGKKPRFKFQFFQKLEGVLQVPDGYKPEHILVRVVPEGKKQQAIQQSFSWNSVLTRMEEHAG